MKVSVQSPDPAWRPRFLEHEAAIARALRHLRPSIDHIGSTSLGDIAAKPIIDVLVGLEHADHLDEAVGPMVASGYAYVERFTPAMPYRRFFARLAPLSDRPVPGVIGARDALAFGRDYESSAHVHVMVRGTHHWVRHVAFRDYLRAHPSVRAEYEALKLRIAELELADPLEYNAHKEPFIAEHEPRALAWFGRQGAR